MRVLPHQVGENLSSVNAIAPCGMALVQYSENMSLRYSLRESFSGFKRAKLSSTITIFTITISLVLLSIFIIITLNAKILVDSVRERIELEAFLQNTITQSQVNDLRQKIQTIPGVARITYISKEEAARIFEEEFGEDINSVLNFNPLPPSFKITLKEEYRTSERVQEIYNRLTKLDGVESVRYRKMLLELLDKRAQLFTIISIGLGAIIALSSIFLVSNTIRLAIYAKRRIISTMKLIGATQGFIRRPFIIEGVLHGFIGGSLAAGFIYVLIEVATTQVSPDVLSVIYVGPYFYSAIVIVGCALGFFGSLISIRRFLGDMATS